MIAQDSLQERLAAAYRLQAKHYDDALHIATQDGQAFDQDAWDIADRCPANRGS